MKKDEVIRVIESIEKESDIVQAIYLMFGKTIKIELPFSDSLCNSKIDDINFSTRSLNALKRSNIFTIGELITILKNDELKKVRNLGVKSYNEIQTKTMVYGFENLSENGKKRFYKRLVELNLSEDE